METSGIWHVRIAGKLLIGLCLLLAFSRVNACAQVIDWPTLGFSQFGTNIFYEPTYITHARDGSQRLFVLEQPGRIWVLQNTNRLAQPFLEITNRVTTFGAEEGLLGLAFPPGFSTNNHFYVDYTRSPDGAIVLSRFFLTATNSNIADSNSEHVLLVIPKPFTLPGARTPNRVYDNHNAGQLAFGPDGYLYMGVGDGGSENDPLRYGQATTNLFGKILRIDVESGVSPYAIPPSNPYASSNNFVPETWAYGLRNPWRFSFDDLTGDLYIGDVGQYSYEEIDFQPAGSPGGQNYGWSIMEGNSNFFVPSGFTNFASLTLPAAVYSHASLPGEQQAAVIGGYVYRGPSMPRMNGIYFYGDFITGGIWGLKEIGTNWQNQVLVTPIFSNEGTNWISTFGEDDQGQLYLADYYAGKIYQVQDTFHVWAPFFSQGAGVIYSNTMILSCLSTNAEIHYTTNGVDPTFSDPIVPSGATITVATGITNKAIAFRSDFGTSEVTRAIFTLEVAHPVFNPTPVTLITSNTLVSVSSITPGVTFYYTLDGSTPTTNSSIYTGPLPVSGGMTMEALGVLSGYTSSLGIASYNAAQVAAPGFIPGAESITNGTSILMSCITPGAVIHYTLDGSIPTPNSAIYTGPVTISGGTTIYAIATLTNYVNSPLTGAYYPLVQAATPTFNPAFGPINYGTNISITSSTPGSTIFYTLDATTPTIHSAIYSSPLAIYGSTTLSAMATAPGFTNSAVQSVVYQLTFAFVGASVTNNVIQFSWSSVAGQNYAIQWSSDLILWHTIGSPIPGNGSLLSSSDTMPINQSQQRFYRIVTGF